MNNIEIINERKKQEQIYRRYKRKQSVPIIAAIIAIFCGYAFFFLSPRIFHRRPEALNTAIGEVQKLNEDISFSITKWSYSESQNLMEVLLDVKNISLQYNNSDFSYYAVCNYMEESKGSIDCIVKPKIEDFNYLSLWIYNIPKDFNSCALYIYIENTKDQTNENLNVQLYASREKVDYVKTIKDKKYEDYKIEEYQRDIKSFEKKIDSNKKSIDTLYDDITKLKNFISKTKKSEIYQSAEEIEQSEEMIKGYKDDIADKENQINNLKLKNTSLYQEIENYKKLINKIKNNK